MICNVSYSVTTHAKDLYQDNRLSSSGLRHKLNSARFVVANSEFSAAGLQAAFNGRVPPRIVTIYNSVDLSEFPHRSEEPTEPKILSVGRLVEKKGLGNLLIACRKLKDWDVRFTCEIIGSGPLKESLADSIIKLGLAHTVKLRGEMPQLEVRDHYLKAMIFALPCVVAANGDRDILPNVIKEAMAIGLPVVTTQLDGIEELVKHEETGLVVRAGDTEALAKSLRRLLSDRALRRQLSTQARKVIEERFDLNKNFGLLRNLLLEAVGGANHDKGAERSEEVQLSAMIPEEFAKDDAAPASTGRHTHSSGKQSGKAEALCSVGTVGNTK